MTAPISGNRLQLPLAQTVASDAVAKKPTLPLAPELASGGELSQKRLQLHSQDIAAFDPVGKLSVGPALLGGVAEKPLKSLGKQAAIGNALEVAGNALASAQAGLELAASLVSRPQFSALKNEAVGALAGAAAQMPQGIANTVAGAINNGTALQQVDVLQGIAHTQGPLAAGNLEAGAYSADQLGQYGGAVDPMAQYGGAVDPMAQFAQVAGGVGDLAGGMSDLASLRDAFKKPSLPESKPSSAKPSAPESKPSSAKPSVPDSKPSVKPSVPEIKPSILAGKGDDIAKGLLKTGGKALSRFVPGANIAMAGLDIANAVSTIKDPNASLGDKITSGIVAGGSALAATNIPIVSQVGGAISTGASIAGEVVKNFGGAIKDGAKAVGEGIKDTAKKVGEGIKDTAKKVGEGIKDFFKGW
ncbi:hypothetical protein [Vitiosangium sp. GDMCC 1.1324]|uniref:hypothetical protein n=1 Tax=Vitiosangium sp. (strain GDMCC 1.1324) TaxID=2138576 RepID=UPI000D34F823|nr:hypothetical protein [Vitiosangium sp. GDMCC 1.1324]PTL76614.1 hypothetical protein DAT35_49290 [Vitiosangium sp. GDMCC 1.1324]